MLLFHGKYQLDLNVALERLSDLCYLIAAGFFIAMFLTYGNSEIFGKCVLSTLIFGMFGVSAGIAHYIRTHE